MSQRPRCALYAHSAHAGRVYEVHPKQNRERLTKKRSERVRRVCKPPHRSSQFYLLWGCHQDSSHPSHPAAAATSSFTSSSSSSFPLLPISIGHAPSRFQTTPVQLHHDQVTRTAQQFARSLISRVPHTVTRYREEFATIARETENSDKIKRPDLSSMFYFENHGFPSIVSRCFQS